MARHAVYECGICDCYHPWEWDGDCREDANRFPGPEEYAEKVGVSVDEVEVLTMDERVAADAGEDEEEEEGERISCDKCEMLSINGVACHEIGCPNMGARWEEGEWVQYIECFECGCDVRKGEVCSCQEPFEEDEE